MYDSSSSSSTQVRLFHVLCVLSGCAPVLFVLICSLQALQSRFQDNQQHAAYDFPAYDSPFESYPLLRSRLRRLLSDLSPPITQDQRQQEAPLPSLPSYSSIPSFISSSSTFPIVFPSCIPDLKPLKKAASFEALDPSKQICQYELPGGGVCRDEGCQDVHLSRGLDGVEPTGTLFPRLICSCALALDWLMRISCFFF